MADSVLAHFLFPLGMKQGGAGLVPAPGAAMDEEGQPAIMWGQGTPDGNLAPFNLVNKGSLYMEVNGTDDTAQLWQKVDEGGETGTADWVRCLVENHQIIDTNDISATAGITSAQIADGAIVNVDVNASAAIAYSKLNLTGAVLVEDLETNALSTIVVLPTQVDISAADSEFVEFHAVAALVITEIGLLWQEATEGSGAAEGDVTIGISTGNGDVVSAANGAYAVSQAIGDYQALTITDGIMTAGESLFVSHDVAASATGLYQVLVKYDLDS